MSLFGCPLTSVSSDSFAIDEDWNPKKTKQSCETSICAERAIVPSSVDKLGHTIAGAKRDKPTESCNDNKDRSSPCRVRIE